jgi:hypothetical protein
MPDFQRLTKLSVKHALTDRTRRACADCYKLQSELELQAGAEAQPLYCFAGAG